MAQSKLVVLGSGTWGVAWAAQLVSKQPVMVWGRDPQKVAQLNIRRQHPHLPGITLPKGLQFSADISTVAGANCYFIASSVAGLGAVCQQLKSLLPREANVVLLCKGFVHHRADGLNPQTPEVFLPHHFAQQILGRPVAVLSGPTFAHEVAQGLPAAMVLACSDARQAAQLQTLCALPQIRIYRSEDIVGVEVGGAVKNVLAIAAGICDGYRLGANARAALLTRGLNEMLRLGAALQARPETLFGLSGMGDLILTATGQLSRNRQAGLLIAEGLTLESIREKLQASIEGAAGVEQILAVAARHSIEMPITQAVANVLYHGVAARLAIDQLLGRELKSEATITSMPGAQG